MHAHAPPLARLGVCSLWRALQPGTVTASANKGMLVATGATARVADSSITGTSGDDLMLDPNGTSIYTNLDLKDISINPKGAKTEPKALSSMPSSSPLLRSNDPDFLSLQKVRHMSMSGLWRLVVTLRAAWM
jgi:hypothetical protein